VALGVFIHRSDSIYDDSPAERYQFPNQYLARVETCVGDWIVYYEPRKAHESRGYFAVAKIQRVIPDPGTSDMYIAVIEPGSYLDLSSRIVRDRVFRRIVLRAYDARCAITSLKLINGSGRAEVEAAHIRPVEANGPDVVSNGLALSGTAHWMFDRGLISVADDHEILISRHVNDTAGVHAVINKTGRILTPSRAVDRPHPHFLRWHRENCFKA
jgi:predicted restriction endonuclease